MIEKIKEEIKRQIKDLENDYDMSYGDMHDCYLKNDEPLPWHIGVSYIEGMERVVKLHEIFVRMEKENEAK